MSSVSFHNIGGDQDVSGLGFIVDWFLFADKSSAICLRVSFCREYDRKEQVVFFEMRNLIVCRSNIVVVELELIA